jgi:hypothetical protein
MTLERNAPHLSLYKSTRLTILHFVLSRSRAPIEMYVDSDPSMCAWVFETQAVPSVLVSHPSHLPVEHRPDAPKSVRKWSDIEDAVNRVNLAKSKVYAKPVEADLWQD